MRLVKTTPPFVAMDDLQRLMSWLYSYCTGADSGFAVGSIVVAEYADGLPICITSGVSPNGTWRRRCLKVDLTGARLGNGLLSLLICVLLLLDLANLRVGVFIVVFGHRRGASMSIRLKSRRIDYDDSCEPPQERCRREEVSMETNRCRYRINGPGTLHCILGRNDIYRYELVIYFTTVSMQGAIDVSISDTIRH